MAENIHEEQLQISIAKALLYSDIFSYPLTVDEIFQRLTTNHTCADEVMAMLGKMKGEGIVFQFGNFYTIRNEQELERRRMAGNQLARDLMPAAMKRGKLLGTFPFIRAVMISGSLSKNYMDKGSDVDFFVVTQPGRLWIARLFVVLFKRVFLFNSHKRFCVNYYLDEEHLEIEEKNIFTATELASLIPVCGSRAYEQLMQNNEWVKDFFPNVDKSGSEVPDLVFPWWKKAIESFVTPFGDRMDRWILGVASRHYQRRYGHLYPVKDFNVAFKSRRGVSKNHNRNFQKHVTELYDSKVERFTRKHPISTSV